MSFFNFFEKWRHNSANRWDEKALAKKAKVADGAAKANAKQLSNDIKGGLIFDDLWRNFAKMTSLCSKINLWKDEARKLAALMSDANKFLEQQELAGKRDQGLSIPLLMQNKVPEGFEEEEGALKVDVRPESSKLEDYDEVPVGQ